MESESGVALQFSHHLSQIEFKAKSESETYKFQVKGVRIAKIGSTGDFDFTDGIGSWTLGDEKKTYDKIYTDEEAVIELGATAQSLMYQDYAMLIPQELTAWNVEGDQTNNDEGAYLSVYIRITTKEGALVYPFEDDDEDYAWAAIPVPAETKWEAGKKYVYTLIFTNGAGYVDPSTGGNHTGNPILDGDIRFTVEVEGWEDAENNPATDTDVDMPVGDGSSVDDNDVEDPGWD